MYHVRNRVYDPRRMIWLQRDPLGQLAGPDEYAYVMGEPRDFYDPMGLSAWGDYWHNFAEGAAYVVEGWSDGDAAHNFVEGAKEIIHPESEAGVVTQKVVVATAVGVATAGVGTAVVGGTSIVGAAVIGGVSGAAGDAAAQGIAIAQGNQDEFSYRELGTATAIGAGFGAGGQILSKTAPALNKSYYPFGGKPAGGAPSTSPAKAPAKGGEKPTTGNGCPAEAPGGQAANVKPSVVEVDPATLRFSQRTAGGNGRAGPLRTSMGEKGYVGDPVDVVVTDDGLVTVDNTRVAIAQELGIKTIPARVHSPAEPLPPEMAGRFGSARTWGEALHYRTGNQTPPLGPTGTGVPPRLPR